MADSVGPRVAVGHCPLSVMSLPLWFLYFDYHMCIFN